MGAWMLASSLLTIYSWQDILEQKISVNRLIFGFAVAFIGSFSCGDPGTVQGLQEYTFKILIGMIPGGMMVFLARIMKSRMGVGDGLVLMIVGVLLGSRVAFAVLVVALVLAFIYSCVLVLRRKRNATFPFVPFYLLGIACVWSMSG
jgi:leader peptidase (prepilin peptidase)/N-methyltransferase